MSIGARSFNVNAGNMFNNRIKDFGVFLDVKSMARDRIMTYRELLTNPSIANLLYVEKSISLMMFGRLCTQPKCVFGFICYNFVVFFLTRGKMTF